MGDDDEPLPADERLLESLTTATRVVDKYNREQPEHTLEEDHIVQLATIFYHDSGESMEEVLDQLGDIFPGDDRGADDYRIG